MKQLTIRTAGMTAGSLKKIPEGAAPDHPYRQNTRARAAVLRKRAFACGSAEMAGFAETLQAP